jgi:hypothetical protein
MDQEVTEYIRKIDQEWQAEVCDSIRQRIRQSVPDVQERLQYRKPHFLKNGAYLCVLGTARAWVSFTIFNATELKAPEGTFEPGGNPERRTVKIREGQDVDYDLLETLVRQAADSLEAA